MSKKRTINAYLPFVLERFPLLDFCRMTICHLLLYPSHFFLALWATWLCIIFVSHFFAPQLYHSRTKINLILPINFNHRSYPNEQKR